MKKNLTEIVFILDRSGSMAGLESDTIGGYNAMLEKQKKEKGEAFVSTILFDDTPTVIHDRIRCRNCRVSLFHNVVRGKNTDNGNRSENDGRAVKLCKFEAGLCIRDR